MTLVERATLPASAIALSLFLMGHNEGAMRAGSPSAPVVARSARCGRSRGGLPGRAHDCVSHAAAGQVKKLSRDAAKPFVPLRSASLSGFVVAVADQLTGATEALSGGSA